MDIRETIATLGTQDTTHDEGKRDKKKPNTENLKYEQHGSNQKPGVIPGAREG